MKFSKFILISLVVILAIYGLVKLEPIKRFNYALDDYLGCINIQQCSFADYRQNVENCL